MSPAVWFLQRCPREDANSLTSGALLPQPTAQAMYYGSGSIAPMQPDPRWTAQPHGPSRKSFHLQLGLQGVALKRRESVQLWHRAWLCILQNWLPSFEEPQFPLPNLGPNEMFTEQQAL